MDDSQWEAVDALLDCWSNWDLSQDYYLSVLVPDIVRRGTHAAGTAREGAAIRDLRRSLTDDEWANLRELIAQGKATAEQRALRRNEQRLDEARLRRLSEKQAAEDARRAEGARKLADERAAEEIRVKKQQLQAVRARELQERHRAHEEAADRMLQELHAEFESRYLDSEAWLANHPSTNLISAEQFRQAQATFVADWSLRTLSIPLDPDQARTVAAVGRHAKVSARAGSGKTRTIAVRALFLQLHCGVPPGSILLLAFNKHAAREMEERVQSKLEGSSPPLCMTFHALAYALVQPEEALTYDQGDDHRAQSRLLQQCIDELIRSPLDHLRIRKLMLSYYRDDWSRITARGDHLSPIEAMELRRHLERETLRGEFVKSQGERLLANILFEHGVDYRYEWVHDWNGTPYRPDFTILLDRKPAVVIEYFGMQGRDHEYDSLTKDKLEYWKTRTDVTFWDLYPRDLAAPDFPDQLMDRLRGLGPRYERIDAEALWRLVKDRAEDRFTGTVKSLVNRARQRRWDSQRLLRELAKSQEISAPAELFVSLGAKALNKYEEALVRTDADDFTGLLWRAVDRMRGGTTTFQRNRASQVGDLRDLKYVLIDEFQDFSEMFAQLTQGILAVAPEAEIFAVGDDWQAINEFAGSDLKYFRDFLNTFSGGVELPISTNYRSARAVVECGNALMHGQGIPAIPGSAEHGWVGLCDVATFTPNAFEEETYKRDFATPVLLRLLHQVVTNGKSVVLLTRRTQLNGVSVPEGAKAIRNIFDYAAFLKSRLPSQAEELLTVSTAHSYKGAEADVAIVLDADSRNFPLVHPSLEFFRIFGDTYETVLAAERRLFYVATTRARERLLYLYDSSRNVSDFVAQIDEYCGLTSQDPNRFGAISSGTDIQIRVYGGFNQKAALQAAGLRWHPRGKYWAMTRGATGFDPLSIRQAPWYTPDQRIELRNDADQVIEVVPPQRHDEPGRPPSTWSIG